MFNVKLPWDDPLNQKLSKDQPENYKAMAIWKNLNGKVCIK